MDDRRIHHLLADQTGEDERVARWAQRELAHAHRIHARINVAPSQHWFVRALRALWAWC